MHWEVHTAWSGDEKIECVRIGDADRNHPGVEAVAVDTGGRVILVRGPELSTQVLYRHTARLTGLLVADVDPDVPGEEIYAGGYQHDETGGVVLQIVLDASGAVHARRVFEGGAFIHAMGCLPPAPGSTTPRLLVTDYAAELHVAEPRPGDGLWPSRLLHKEPPTDAFEGNEIKEVVIGPIGGGPVRVFVAVKSGRGLLMDADSGDVQVIVEQPGGIARAALDHDGSLWLGCTEGKLLHLIHEDGRWHAETVFDDGAGIRGVALGHFPLDGGAARLVTWGYSMTCRAYPDTGPPVTLFADTARGHWMSAGDLVPGNDADEIALASYGQTLRVLVARRTHSAP